MSETPLTVLHALHRTTSTSGALQQAIEAAQGLRAIGHDAVLLTRPDTAVGRRCSELDVRHVSQRLRHPLDVASMRRLAEIVASLQVDVVHVHCGVTLGVALGAAAVGARFALVANRATSFRPQPILSKALRSPRVHRIVATSLAVRDVLLARIGPAAGKVVVVPGSVDLARFDGRNTHPLAVRRRLGIPDSAPIVGHVGIRDWKGWKQALAAMTAVTAALPEARLLLAGCTSDRQRHGVLQLAGEVSLADHVVVVPVIDAIADVLAACNVVVDPSWAGTATSGVIREAMALARPVVATAVGGNAELVEDGVSGLIVAPRDVATLAAAVVRLLGDAELASRLGTAARARVRDHFSPELRALRLVAVYREALADLAAGGAV
jgi:glycosyltransferase involved in cell wall biosynthesis